MRNTSRSPIQPMSASAVVEHGKAGARLGQAFQRMLERVAGRERVAGNASSRAVASCSSCGERALEIATRNDTSQRTVAVYTGSASKACVIGEDLGHLVEGARRATARAPAVPHRLVHSFDVIIRLRRGGAWRSIPRRRSFSV